MTIYDFLPKFIRRIIADRPRFTVTHEYWNELFNLLINQGDHGQEAIQAIMQQLTTNVLFKDNEEPWEPLNDYQPATVKFVTDRIEFMGGGDMVKASYDRNGDGVVDDSERLGGQLPAFYATASHEHSDKADLVDGKVPLEQLPLEQLPSEQLPGIDIIPVNHASSATTYGVGSTAAYGHCKTIDSLTRTTYTSGEALSAKQGNVLNTKITTLNTQITALDTQITAINTKLNGKTLWVGSEGSRGSNANTIYFCY